MPGLTPSVVVETLRTAVPEFGPSIDEHVSDFGEVLPHVLFGDLTRFVLAAHARGDADVEQRSLDALDMALRNGDDETRNLVAVSFVESVGPSESSQRAFIDSWPDALRNEARRQREWKSGSA
jgi:hypothetical protein